MSDKSFGDHTNRNIVKNPLLSSAVTGLSLEDLTHKAVLLPVTPSLGQITRSDQQQGFQTRTLAHADHDTPFPSGDAFSNITQSNITQITNPNIVDSQNDVKQEKNRGTSSVTQSKASLKSDDDFDVNEYIARLQGTRYVSAPLHSHLKEDKNANLEATEENLEEINLNESQSQSPVEVQQSLTADIAQNFSQLPTVLPHVASAVFSSFSNMLYKSREQTPDRANVVPESDQRGNKGYDEVQFQRPDVGIPMMGMEDYGPPKEVAPPPKEPPIGGTSNFRLTTKKKYAQIPGLSSGDPAQTMTYNAPSQNIPIGHNIPPTVGQYMPPLGQNLPPIGQNMPLIAPNVAPIGQNMPPLAPNVAPTGQNMFPFGSKVAPLGHNLPPIGQNIPSFFNPNEAKRNDPNEQVELVFKAVTPQHILSPVSAENQTVTKEVAASESQIKTCGVTDSQQTFFTPIEHREQATQLITPNQTVPGTASIIPPPPMFSNLPRKYSQPSTGKTILPPSVARRISANQPIIKPAVSTPSFSENYFVPSPVSESANESSVQAEHRFPIVFPTSAFVPANTNTNKPDPIAPLSSVPASSQMMTHPSKPPPISKATAPTYFIPSNEEKPQMSTEVPTYHSPQEIAPAVDTAFNMAHLLNNLITPVSKSTFIGGAELPSTGVSNIGPTPLPQSTTSILKTGTKINPAQTSIFQQKEPDNDPPPPTFFNPLQHAQTHQPFIMNSPTDAPHPITQFPPMTNPEPPKPVAEPPKASGNVNFRMTKKRPQYYAGPIEGIGAISNNIKPIIAPVIPAATPAETSSFHGALFTPEQTVQPSVEQYAASNIELTSVPFDISRPVENVISRSPFDISKPQDQVYSSPFNLNHSENQSYGLEYNMTFDMSRATTEPYGPPKQESKGFGIIGSLKSKLSSIDINKIQSTVTTFFDPAYNESKVTELVAQDNIPYTHQQQYERQLFEQSSQGQTNFDIRPNIEQSQYGQFKHASCDYNPNNHYYQSPDQYAQNQGQNVYPSSEFFSDQSYLSKQVYSGNPLYDSKKENLPAVENYLQNNIPVENLSTDTSKSTDNATFYNPHAFTQERIPTIDQLQSFSRQQLGMSTQQNIEQHKTAAFVGTTDQAPDNIAHYNPNAYVHENRQIPDNPQHSFDISASYSQPIADANNKNTYSVFTSEKSQEPIFYNPNVFPSENQTINTRQPLNVLGNDMQQKTYQANADLTSKVHKTVVTDAQIDPYPNCDSALNTSKYNMSSIQTPGVQQNLISRVPLAPAASCFDNPQTINLSLFSKDGEKDDIKLEDVEEQFESKNIEINKMLADTPVPAIVTKSRDDFAIIDKPNKDREADNEQVLKESNPLETLSKDDIPILGVSTVPLFGLSAMIADKSREISESENEMKHLSLFETAQPSRNVIEGNSGVSFFENMKSDDKPTNENQARNYPLDITEIRNVILFEPPQEHIGALFKRNTSSSKLEGLSKASDQASSEHFRQENDNLPSTSFQEKLHLKFDENASEIFFKHSPSVEKEDQDLEKESSVKSQDSELNICETCREVNTPDCHRPDHNDTEDLTNHMIENITSRMALSNPLITPLIESDAPIEDTSRFDDQQFEEITHVAEDTFDTLQVQSATELLDEEIISEVNNYGWTTEGAAYSAAAHVDHDYGCKVDSDPSVPTEQNYDFPIDVNPTVSTADNDYEFKLDPNAIGFFGTNSVLLDNLPKNASDEIKAEIKNSHDDIVLPRQISIPSAPPAEDDTKSDETGGLDVHSIEQDAKKDFPLEEEFIIEPSETDDDKMEFRERKRSSEDSLPLHDTFTNRIDRFKKELDHPDDDATKKGQVYGSPLMSMASYFDTGNYAVESHYRNSLNSPTSINTFRTQYNIMRIPPGFEEEYARRLRGMCLSSGENRKEVHIPDTSTQTCPISTATFASSNTTENIIGFEIRRQENIDAFAKSATETTNPNMMPKPSQTISNPLIFALPTPTFTGFSTDAQPIISSDPKQATGYPLVVPSQNVSGLVDLPYVQPEIISKVTEPLPDPMSFFSENLEKPTPTTESAAPENFNRLASYFSMPPAQPEPSKSFFELSQSQNHYRHDSKTEESDNKIGHKPFFELHQTQQYMDDDVKNKIKNLMEDLTSPKNIQEQVVRTVNYFTVEHDTEIKRNTNAAAPINVKINDTVDQNKMNDESPKTDIENIIDLTKLVEIDRKDFEAVINCQYCFNVVPAINTKDFKFRTAMNDSSNVTTSAITTEKESTGNKTTTMTLGNFDLEGQSREGVAVITEHRPDSEYSPVVHHWFYRVDVEEKSVWRGFSLTDSRKLEETLNSPELNESTLVATDGGRYDVNVVGRLRIAVYWKEKPTNVRRCSWFYKGTTDARYVPYTEAVAEKLEDEYRHGVTTGEWHRRLTLPNNEMVIMHGPTVMVHFLQSGATDAFSTPPQTTSRPRVVRRGNEESEIEDSEPSRIDHLLLLCHGVGSACDMRFRSVEEVVEDFRATTLQLLQSHYRNSYENGVVSRVEVLPVSWHAQLHAGENGVDRRLSRVTLDSIPRLRAFTNHTVLDVLFYTSPVFHQTIIETVCSEMNRIYSMFKKRNPYFKGHVSLGGHSLGSVILYDLLCHQISETQQPKSPSEKTFVVGTTGSDQPTPMYPQLVFSPAALYALGSPIAIFECIRGVESLGMDFALPTCKNFFNIFHPYDPIAYRIEPLINPQLQAVKPSQIPHHKGRKRMHLELKDTMTRVGADLKQKLIESLRTTWNKWKATPPIDGQLEKVVEEEVEKERLCEDGKEGPSEVHETPEMLGHLNSGRRIDYVLQEAPLEMINEYLFAMTSHVGYWESEDTMLLMLREIYSSLGIQPDCSVPQQSMTVQRSASLSAQDPLISIHEKELPSTSRAGT